MGQHLHLRVRSQFPDTVLVSLADGTIEHGAGNRAGHEFCQLCLKCLHGPQAIHNHQAGIRAHLPHPDGHGTVQARGEGFATFGQGTSEQNRGIDAAHFSVDGNGFGTFRRQFHQGQTACARAGESHRLDRRMLHQRLPHTAPASKEQRKHALWQSTRRHRRLHGASHEFRRSRVAAMGLHNHRASRRPRGTGISSCDGESEGEITRTKNHHRAEGALHRTQVHLGNRLAVRICMIDPGIAPGAVLNRRGVQAQLPRRAPGFHLDAGFRQAGFIHGPERECFAQIFDPACNLAQKRPAFPTTAATEIRKGRLSQLRSPGHFRRCGPMHGWLQSLARRCLVGM